MLESRVVSEFTIRNKDTPNTAASQSNAKPGHCQFCLQNLSVATSYRKNQILLQLQLQNSNQKVQQLTKQNQELINRKVLTYNQYQKRVEGNNDNHWNRQDIEAELFEAKVIIELLLVSKSSHPQVKLITDQSLRQRYTETLLDNLKLKEMVEVRDRVIEERGMFPIYHYDKRVETLRKAVGFWFRKSEDDVTRMKNRCRDMKLRLEEDKNALNEEVRREMAANQQKMHKVDEMIEQLERSSLQVNKKLKQTPLPIQKKKNAVNSSVKINQIKKMR